MLRITQSPAMQLTTINLEGKLLAPWVEEARHAVDKAKAQGVVRLNLHELNFADHDGIRLLQEFRKAGVELINASALIDGMLTMPD